MILIIFKIFKIYIKYSSCNYSKRLNFVYLLYIDFIYVYKFSDISFNGNFYEVGLP